MKTLGREEWIAVVIALILGVAIFALNAFFRIPAPTASDGVTAGDTMPVAGESSDVADVEVTVPTEPLQ